MNLRITLYCPDTILFATFLHVSRYDRRKTLLSIEFIVNTTFIIRRSTQNKSTVVLLDIIGEKQKAKIKPSLEE